MQVHISEFLAAAEAAPPPQSRSAAFAALRPLGLTDYGSVLWAAPLADFPQLDRHLPPMSPTEVQQRWTGSHGQQLLRQSLSFVQSCSENYTAITGKTLRHARILDFGCGYARFLRLFSFYSDDVWGCDPWETSLEMARAAGFADRVRKSEAVPRALPFDGTFDFAFAFSVFTHLNQTAATACLAAIRDVMGKDGLLCITIRPVEYWEAHFRNHHPHAPKTEVQRYQDAHHTAGYAFFSHGAKPDDPDGTYGDSSMTLDHLAACAHRWKIIAVDRALDDPMQRYVFLQAV